MDQLEQAKNAALKYVTARVRTQRQVQQQLTKKGYDAETISQVVAFLQSYQYLDDAAYCRCWILDRIQFHPCGRQKMAFDLAKEIMDRQLVHQSLEEFFPSEQELELAIATAQKKLSSSRSNLSREKLSRFLYSKGYGNSIISHILQMESIAEQLDQGQDDDDNNF